MQTAHQSLTKQRKQQNMILSREAKGGLNLGKKISVPKDVMMEELNLNTNRGSIMFQQRQRRVERFTLENSADAPSIIYNNMEQNRMMTDMQGGKENLLYPVAGKHSLVTSLKNTVAKKGSPNVLAPGYSGPLREIPREKFNATVIPKSYCSPWQEALGENEELLSSLNTQIAEPPQKLPPANYRCFNRAAVPFGGPVRSQRVIPVIGFEALETPSLSSLTLATMSKRRNFNRAPRGWGVGYSPESNDL
ncbi:myozenin-2 isoform X1 [Sinocyclocheilus rhinocerous]|uniref:myozenin-2 isoform X1 n=2 Tax=Sinocyclocheilus rhinocerous TaxID=307959 RepID=UPI0007B9A43B|nr:PREDICTED: myozenin-2-like isoform X1 [Sinocyclocheilus rhinocerous]